MVEAAVAQQHAAEVALPHADFGRAAAAKVPREPHHEFAVAGNAARGHARGDHLRLEPPTTDAAPTILHRAPHAAQAALASTSPSFPSYVVHSAGGSYRA